MKSRGNSQLIIKLLIKTRHAQSDVLDPRRWNLKIFLESLIAGLLSMYMDVQLVLDKRPHRSSSVWILTNKKGVSAILYNEIKCSLPATKARDPYHLSNLSLQCIVIVQQSIIYL